MANVDLIRNLLPILSNLDLAKQHVPESLKPSARREGAASEESLHGGVARRNELIKWFQGMEISINQLNKVPQIPA